MSQASRPDSPFRWSGSLKEQKIAQLYERCQRLRLTGNMQLSNGAQTIDLVWIGGEPIENEGDAGTRTLPLWNDGTFVVEQRIPDWRGRLTGSTELTGSLRAGQIQAIYKLCADNQLSAEVELVRASGEAAQVRFTHGKAEQAAIAGQTESALTALSKLSAWTDGTFRITLRPLFGDERVAEAPVFAKKDSESQFDVTGAVDASRDQNWLAVAGAAPVPAPARPAAAPSPQPASSSGPARPAASAKTPAQAGSSSGGNVPAAGSSGPVIPPRLASTLVGIQSGKDGVPAAAGAASDSQTLPTQPMSVVTKQQIQQAKQAQPASSGKKALIYGSIAILILCAATLATLLLHR
ncbi:MAG: hypothetical protein U1A78_04595 [Polyangia bacterium]